MKTTKKPAKKKKPAPAKKPQSVSVCIKVYPHVLHVHRNGEEIPPFRRMNPSPELVEKVRAEFAAIPGHTVTVEHLSAQGRPL